MLQSNIFQDLLVLGFARGPLANMHSLDVMWVSFYSIAAMVLSMLILSATRKFIKNSFLSSIISLFAFLLFLFGTILMVLVVFTWPS